MAKQRRLASRWATTVALALVAWYVEDFAKSKSHASAIRSNPDLRPDAQVLETGGRGRAEQRLRTEEGDAESPLECSQVGHQSKASERGSTHQRGAVEDLPEGGPRRIHEGEKAVRDSAPAHRRRDRRGQQDRTRSFADGATAGNSWDSSQACGCWRRDHRSLGCPPGRGGGATGTGLPERRLDRSTTFPAGWQRQWHKSRQRWQYDDTGGGCDATADDFGAPATWLYLSGSFLRGPAYAGHVHGTAADSTHCGSAWGQGPLSIVPVTAESGDGLGYHRVTDQSWAALETGEQTASEGRALATCPHRNGCWAATFQQAGKGQTGHATFWCAGCADREEGGHRAADTTDGGCRERRTCGQRRIGKCEGAPLGDSGWHGLKSHTCVNRQAPHRKTRDTLFLEGDGIPSRLMLSCMECCEPEGRGSISCYAIEELNLAESECLPCFPGSCTEGVQCDRSALSYKGQLRLSVLLSPATGSLVTSCPVVAVILGRSWHPWGLGAIRPWPPPWAPCATGCAVPLWTCAAQTTRQSLAACGWRPGYAYATDQHHATEEGLPEGQGADFQQRPPPHLADDFDIWFGLFETSGRFIVILSRSLLGILGLCLGGLLVRQLPHSHSPLGRLIKFPFHGSQVGPVLVLGKIGSVCGSESPRHPLGSYRSQKDKNRGAGHRTVYVGRLPWRCRLLHVLLGVWSLPVSVWAAPPHLPEALGAADRFLLSGPEPLPIGSGVKGLDSSPGPVDASCSMRNEMEVQQQASPPPIGLRRLPPTQVGPGMPTPETAWQADFKAYVVAPGFLPELVDFPLQLPCEEMDAARAVQQELQRLKLEFSDVVVPAIPQPISTCQTFLVYPPWITFSGGAAVILDLRRCPLNERGPVIAAFVTRPTNLAELRREAGIFSVRNSKVFVCDNPQPLQEDEQVYLETGC